MLWIRSDLWFSFLSRRLKILNTVHEKIYRLQPPNYGVLSGLFAYLMQSVIFTPPIVNVYVRECLAALQYKRNCDVFGMFFLDSLDVERRSCMIEGILGEDDSLVKGILGPLVRKPRLPLLRREEEEEGLEDEERFPIGERPTWKEITRSVELNPTVLIRRWDGLPVELLGYSEGCCEEGSMEHKAGLIFVKFTRQIWMALHEEWRIEPEFDISPGNVPEAMLTWTVDFILNHCVEPIFRACGIAGLEHVTGRRVASFGERVKIYFPLSDEELSGKGNFWTSFGQEPGYLHDFWELVRESTPAEGTELQRCLEELLEQCQCQPDSARSKSTNRGWHVDRKRVVILTNPKLYRIRGVGEEGKGTRLRKEHRSAPAHRSEKERNIRMLQQAGYTRDTATRAVRARQTIKKRRKHQEVRSTRAKNKRVPPNARNRKKGTEKSSEEGEKEKGSDESTESSVKKQGTEESRGERRAEKSSDERSDSDNSNSIRKEGMDESTGFGEGRESSYESIDQPTGFGAGFKSSDERWDSEDMSS